MRWNFHKCFALFQDIKKRLNGRGSQLDAFFAPTQDTTADGVAEVGESLDFSEAAISQNFLRRF